MSVYFLWRNVNTLYTQTTSFPLDPVTLTFDLWTLTVSAELWVPQRAALPVLFLFRGHRGRFVSFSFRRGDTLHRSRWNLSGRGVRSSPSCLISTWSAQGCGFTAPKKTLKIWNFINIIAPKGRVPCTILTKFIGFMRVLVYITLPNLAALAR